MTHALMIWTFVACQSQVCVSDWRELRVFSSKELCETAAKDMNLKDRYRCVLVGK
jgi:hypothetical protein